MTYIEQIEYHISISFMYFNFSFRQAMQQIIKSWNLLNLTKYYIFLQIINYFIVTLYIYFYLAKNVPRNKRLFVTKVNTMLT